MATFLRPELTGLGETSEHSTVREAEARFQE